MASLIHRLTDSAAERRPEGQAVVAGRESATWEEVAGLSDRVAAVLRAEGVRAGDRVGVLLPKDVRIPAAVYGIMKAGAAYVPLDPTAPTERQRTILEDCGARWLVSAPSQRSTVEQLSAALDLTLGLDEGPAGVRAVGWGDVASAPGGGSGPRVVEGDLAYVIYTSGSTGTPKGIMHSHRSGVVYAEWAVARYGLTEVDRLSNHAPLHFDMSTFDWFVAAAAAATTVVIPEPHLKLPASHTQLLQDERVTVVFAVPHVLTQMLLRGVLGDRDLGALRWVIFGGETSSTRHVRQLMELLPHVRFNHMYGPAETNGCTCYDLEAPPVGDEPIPIGVAFEHMETLVLDADDRPVGPGASGELLVRGPTTMLGYWGRPDLTGKSLHRRERAAGVEEVFYRTGDLVSVLPSGDLRFIGRQDRQVKVRGFRIELEEIEAALASHDAVAEACAYVAGSEESRRVEAALLPEPSAELRVESVLELVRARLPGYAVPARLQVVGEFPRTTTGKVDRRRVQADAGRAVTEVGSAAGEVGR